MYGGVAPRRMRIRRGGPKQVVEVAREARAIRNLDYNTLNHVDSKKSHFLVGVYINTPTHTLTYTQTFYTYYNKCLGYV